MAYLLTKSMLREYGITHVEKDGTVFIHDKKVKVSKKGCITVSIKTDKGTYRRPIPVARAVVAWYWGFVPSYWVAYFDEKQNEYVACSSSKFHKMVDSKRINGKKTRRD